MSLYDNICACKGIRHCIVCEKIKGIEDCTFTKDEVKRTFVFCAHCQCAYEGWNVDDIVKSHPGHSEQEKAFLDGIYLLPDFITQSEELDLVAGIDKFPWVDSQSGRRKQDFGPRVNFKKQKLKTSNFLGFPFFAFPLLERFKTLSILSDFRAVELCHLEYSPERGASIDPHLDDSWLWGDRLVTINLLSDTVLTLQPVASTPNQEPPCAETETTVIRIPLPKRSLFVLYGTARSDWLHSIQRSDVSGRRLAMTFRELSAAFQTGGENEAQGQELLEKASVKLTFPEDCA